MNACIIFLMVAIATLCSGCRSDETDEMRMDEMRRNFNETDNLDMTLHETDKLGMDLHEIKLRILQLHEGMDRNSVGAILKPITPWYGTRISGIVYYSAFLSTNVSVNLEFTSKDILWAKPDTLIVSTKPWGHGHRQVARLSQIE